MAADFQIKVSGVRSQTDDLVRCVNKLNNVISGAESVRNRLEIDQVYYSLQNVINTLYNEKDKMMKMQLNLHSILGQYDNAENRIKNNAKVVSKVKKPLGSGTGSTHSDTSSNSSTGANTNSGTSGNAGANSNAAVNEKEKEEGPSLVETILKTLFDAGGEFGSIGKTGSLIKNLFQMIIDGDGFTTSDIGALIKGSGDTALGILELIDDYKGNEWKKMLGINTYDGFSISENASRAKNVGNTIKETLKEQLGIYEKADNVANVADDVANVADDVANVADDVANVADDVANVADDVANVADDVANVADDVFKKIDGPKVAGWSLSLIANGFSNAEGWQNGEMSGGRAIAETITETGIDILKGAAITAGVAAGIAAIGVSAPAVVVAGAGVVISAGADFLCEKITGKPVTELVSDTILDTTAKAGEAITGAISSAGEAISGWWGKVKLAW